MKKKHIKKTLDRIAEIHIQIKHHKENIKRLKAFQRLLKYQRSKAPAHA
jgi:hypothetical protein